ncbi:MAG: sugar ABC transporter substrate-binding protein [Sphaerochaetaceae bacterium]
MKKSGIVFLLLALLLFSPGVFANGTAETAAGQGTAPKKTKIAVVLKTLSSEYWQRVANGCKEAAKEFDVDLTISGPPTEDAVVQQINMVEDALANKPDALVFSPSQPQTAVNVLTKAKAAGLPVILIDTPMAVEGFDKYDTFIGTANYDAGVMGAEFLIKQMNGKKARVVIIEGAPGNPTCGQRATGAKDAFTKAGYVLVAYQPGYSDREKAYNVMQNVLQTTDDIDIVFCANDDMALGAQRACAQANVKAKVSGFDGNKSALQSILANDLFCTIAQRPENMGYLGIQYALKKLKGEAFEKNIDAGVDVLYKDNAQAALDKLNAK